MKWLFLVASLLSSPLAYGQTASTTTQAGTYRYCALNVQSGALSDKDGFKLDWGQPAKEAAPDVEMAELAKGVNITSSVLAALNYLGQRGWELVSVTPVQTSIRTINLTTGPEGFISIETHYFFRKRLP